VITITADYLRQHQACPDQLKLFESTFPNGSKLTIKDYRKAEKAGLDSGWSLWHLLADHNLTKDFIVFTLRQRQPHVVSLLTKAGLSGQAASVGSLDWTDLDLAGRVLDAAGDAAWAAGDAAGDAAWAAARAAAWAARDAAWDAAGDAAGDEQVRWIFKALKAVR